eukprot:30867_1
MVCLWKNNYYKDQHFSDILVSFKLGVDGNLILHAYPTKHKEKWKLNWHHRNYCDQGDHTTQLEVDIRSKWDTFYRDEYSTNYDKTMMIAGYGEVKMGYENNSLYIDAEKNYLLWAFAVNHVMIPKCYLNHFKYDQWVQNHQAEHTCDYILQTTKRMLRVQHDTSLLTKFWKKVDNLFIPIGWWHLRQQYGGYYREGWVKIMQQCEKSIKAEMKIAIRQRIEVIGTEKPLFIKKRVNMTRDKIENNWRGLWLTKRKQWLKMRQQYAQ